MSIHVALNHLTHYRYDRLVSLGPQVVRLRPAPHCRTRILSYSLKVTPEKYLRNAHHYLILHGRYTCVAKKPLCWKCPVYEQCGFREKKKFAAMGPDSKPSSPRRRGSSLPKPR